MIYVYVLHLQKQTCDNLHKAFFTEKIFTFKRKRLGHLQIQ